MHAKTKDKRDKIEEKKRRKKGRHAPPLITRDVPLERPR